MFACMATCSPAVKQFEAVGEPPEIEVQMFQIGFDATIWINWA